VQRSDRVLAVHKALREQLASKYRPALTDRTVIVDPAAYAVLRGHVALGDLDEPRCSPMELLGSSSRSASPTGTAFSTSSPATARANSFIDSAEPKPAILTDVGGLDTSRETTPQSPISLATDRRKTPCSGSFSSRAFR
jgi:hypothetical protein